MKAVILAGGFGTRLRPLTCTLPKPMAKLLGKPVLSYILDLLKAHGASDVTLTTAYMPEVIAEFAASPILSCDSTKSLIFWSTASIFHEHRLPVVSS